MVQMIEQHSVFISVHKTTQLRMYNGGGKTKSTVESIQWTAWRDRLIYLEQISLEQEKERC